MKTIFHLHYPSTLTRIVIGQFFILFRYIFFSLFFHVKYFCIMVIILNVFTKNKLINQNWLFELCKMIMHRGNFSCYFFLFRLLFVSLGPFYFPWALLSLFESHRNRFEPKSNQSRTMFLRDCIVYIGIIASLKFNKLKSRKNKIK